MNPKIEEIVKVLRGCALNNGLCSKCVVTGETDYNCGSELMLIAADLIEQLQQELIDERYRHDRLQDFCVAQGEELSRLKAQQRWIPVTERLPEESCAAWIFDRGSRGERSVHFAFFVEKTGWMPPITSEKDAYWRQILEPEPPKEEERCMENE